MNNLKKMDDLADKIESFNKEWENNKFKSDSTSDSSVKLLHENINRISAGLSLKLKGIDEQVSKSYDEMDKLFTMIMDYYRTLQTLTEKLNETK